MPSLHATSQLSAYLTIGSISARHCYLQATKALNNQHLSAQADKGDQNNDQGDNTDINRWISELAWRDFYRHVLSDKPELIRHHAYKKRQIAVLIGHIIRIILMLGVQVRLVYR